MKKIIEINNRIIGDGNPSFLIAEIGSNHNRDKETVFKLIDATADAGFDAVKFQIYDAEEAFSKNEMTTDVGLDHLYGDKPWWEIARDKILMPREWFGEMFEYAKIKKLIPLSAIHRPEDCEFLLQFGLSAIKIASIDFTYYQLLESLIKKFDLPIIISSGMANQKEIENTINFLKKNNANQVCLLHCTSCYPPNNNELNLNNIVHLKEKYEIPIGYSDHYDEALTNNKNRTAAEVRSSFNKHGGNLGETGSVSFGCDRVGNITLDKNFPGPDHPFAIEPHEMKKMVNEIRKTEKMLGSKNRILSENEEKNKIMIRRSVVAKKDIRKNETISLDKIKFARPGTGIQTFEFYKIENSKAKVDIPAETMITHDMVEKLS